MRWIIGSGTHGCWLGSYEYDKRTLFESLVSKGSVVYDIGANVGFYTLLASVLVGEQGQVVAFEPAPRNLLYLRFHLQMNRVTNVTVVEAAVADSSGVRLFDAGPDPSMGFISDRGNLSVKVVTIDELVHSGEAPAPTHLKIDVEGAELSVLRGGTSTLTVCRPTVFLATHSKDLHRDCCGLLSSLGYRLQPIWGDTLDQADEILACPPS